MQRNAHVIKIHTYILPPCFHLLQFYNVLSRPEATGCEYHILFSCRWKYNLSFKTHKRQKSDCCRIRWFPNFSAHNCTAAWYFLQFGNMKKINYLSLSTAAKNNRSSHFVISENPYQKKYIKYVNSEKSHTQPAKRDTSTTDTRCFEITCSLTCKLPKTCGIFFRKSQRVLLSSLFSIRYWSLSKTEYQVNGPLVSPGSHSCLLKSC